MNAPETSIPVLTSVTQLPKAYDAWLCDIWGVMHNGERPFAGAVDACLRFREQGGVIVMISNSPRPRAGVERQMTMIGVPEETYDAVVTSGDSTRAVLKKREGERVFHLGPDRDLPIFEGLDLERVDLEKAEFVLCSGLFDDVTETPDDYRSMLEELKARGLQMICANPDVQVERGHELVYCAGALAAAYEAMGGEVIYTGKPHKPIYDTALDLMTQVVGKQVSKDRILCIGDGVNTDIAGAAAAGMDALYIASALHMNKGAGEKPINGRELSALFRDAPAKPVGAQSSLSW